jgi:hypothetical protein
MPDVRQGSREYNLLLETSSGSTICLSADITEHTTIGPMLDFPDFGSPVVVRSGAVLEGDPPTDVVVVEAGGVLEVGENFFVSLIVAEDGAVVDFTSAGPILHNVNFFYGPNTVVLGDIPSNDLPPPHTESAGEQIPSITPSYGVAPVTVGVPVIVTVEGSGYVVMDPDLPYLPFWGAAELTAVPDPNHNFLGWSGSVVSSQNPISVRMEGDPIAVTATFTSGWSLELFEPPGAHVSRSPDAAIYGDGQTVSLSVTVQPGYEFLGWAGDAAGAASTAVVTMNGHRTVYPMVRPEGYASLPQVAEADPHAVPEGEPITLTGSGLSGISRAWMLWAGLPFPAAVEAVSDAQARVTMPDVTQELRDYVLALETAGGSTVLLPSTIVEHTGSGALSEVSPGPGVSVVVRAGAYLTGPLLTEVVVVETGGRLEVRDDMNIDFLIAEDGAVIDLRALEEESDSYHGTLLLSPGTLVLGTWPLNEFGEPVGIALTSIRPSYGNGTFTVGYPVQVATAGDGAVIADPEGPYYPWSSQVKLTAVPAAGSTFTAWTGDVSSTANPLTVAIQGEPVSLTAVFSAGWVLRRFPIPGAVVEVTPDAAAYPNGQSVSVSVAVQPGYEFLGWAGDLSGTSTTGVLTMDANRTVYPVVRPEGYDQLPQLLSADSHAVPIGGAIGLVGEHLSGVTGARMVWIGMEFPAAATGISATEAAVVMPDVRRPMRDHYLILETSHGSTIGFPTGLVEHTTIGPPTDDPPPGAPIVVRAGAVLRDVGHPLIVVVEAGGIVEVSDNAAPSMIVAEDGAIVDLLGLVDPGPSLVDRLYYSPDAVILGTLPAGPSGEPVATPLASLRPSYDLGTFAVGYSFEVVVEGPGSVAATPNRPYLALGEVVSLEATPDPGAYFIRWIGPLSGHEPSGALQISRDTVQIARFSTAPNYFRVWLPQYFTTEELADPDISGFHADADFDGIANAAEYAFGTDPRVGAGSTHPIEVQVVRDGDDIGIYATYLRPITALDVDYTVLVSADLSLWASNLDGSGVIVGREIGAAPWDEEYELVTVELYPDGGSPETLFVRISATLF